MKSLLLRHPLAKLAAAALLAAAIGSAAHAQNVTASDNASDTNYPGGNWTTGSNGGQGFGPWNLYGTGSHGHFIGNSTLQGFGDVNSDGSAFGMWGNPPGDNYSNAERPFVTPLAAGQSFSIRLAAAYRNGAKGISLFSGTDFATEIWNFNVGGDQYSAGGTNLDWAYAQDSVFTLTANQTSSGTVEVTLSRGSEIVSQTVNGTLGGIRLYVGSTDEGNDLNNFFFNNLQILGDPAPAGNRTVTFHVDMSVQESLGNFNGSNGSVVVIGEFNGWSTENGTIALADAGNGVYSGNGSIFGSEGSTIAYKFFNTTPGAPNGGYEDIADRSLVLGPADVDQNVPVVYFSNQLPSRLVTFSVNMSEQITLGNFNATTGNVSVVGQFNGWNPDAGAILLAGAGNGIYTGNGSISGLANATVEYKFFNSTPGAPNSGYEAGDNRSLLLGNPGTPQIEPLVSYRMPAPPSITSSATASGTVGTSLAYQIQTNPPAVDWPASYALSGNTTLPDGLTLNSDSGLISGTPTADGNTTVQLTATNVGGTGSPFTLDFSIAQAGGSYAAWASSYSLAGDNALPSADPDSDSFTNQQEYAFGTNPTEATAGLVGSSNSGGDLIITFLTRSDLTYTVQSTDNLSTTPFADNSGIPIVDGPAEPAVPTGYSRKQFSVTPGAGKNFYRVLAAEQTPG